MTNQNKRDRLIDSAAILFHMNGLAVTSLADIAKHADIPIGNVYYYFKTKEELAVAAVNKRREQFSAAYSLLEENIADPRQRLIEALHYFDKVRDDYTKYGCPIGKIIVDADIEKDAVVKTAAQVLIEFVSWAQRQFENLGHTDDAKRYATSLVAGIEGAVILAKATYDPVVIADEIARLIQWIETLPNRKIQLGKGGFKTSGSISNTLSAA